MTDEERGRQLDPDRYLDDFLRKKPAAKDGNLYEPLSIHERILRFREGLKASPPSPDLSTSNDRQAPAVELQDQPYGWLSTVSPEDRRVVLDHLLSTGKDEDLQIALKWLSPAERAAIEDDRSRKSYREHFREAAMWGSLWVAGGVLHYVFGVDSGLLVVAVGFFCFGVSLALWGRASFLMALFAGVVVSGTVLLLALFAVLFLLLFLTPSC